MNKVLKVLVSVSCFLAIAGCTLICLYEVYNSYISKDPRNIETYHKAAVNGLDKSNKATADVASPDDAVWLASPKDAGANGNGTAFDTMAGRLVEAGNQLVKSIFGSEESNNGE